MHAVDQVGGMEEGTREHARAHAGGTYIPDCIRVKSSGARHEVQILANVPRHRIKELSILRAWTGGGVVAWWRGGVVAWWRGVIMRGEWR